METTISQRNQNEIDNLIRNKLLKNELPDLYSKGKKKTSRPKTNSSKKPQLQIEQEAEKITTSSKPKTNKSKTDKEKLMMKIVKYQESKRFGDKIKKGLGIKYTRQQLLKCSVENLESILYRIRSFLNTINLDSVFEHMARHCAKGYEDIMSNFLDIEGFSDLLLSNPAFWDAFERYKMEQEMPEIPPSFQMIYIVLSTTYIAHLQNRVKHLNRPQKFKQDIQPSKKPQRQQDLVIVDKDDVSIKTTKNKQSKESKTNNTKSNPSKTKLKIGDIL